MADVTEEDIVKMRLLFDGDGLGRTFLYLLILIITLKELLQLGAQLNIELGGGVQRGIICRVVRKFVLPLKNVYYTRS